MKVAVTRRGQIVTERRAENDVIAFREGKRGTWEAGRNRYEAMGKLVDTEQSTGQKERGLAISLGNITFRVSRS